MQALRPLALLIPLAFAPFAAHAQAFPNKPIKIIYTYAPGGTGDALTRAPQAITCWR